MPNKKMKFLCGHIVGELQKKFLSKSHHMYEGEMKITFKNDYFHSPRKAGYCAMKRALLMNMIFHTVLFSGPE